MTRHRFTSRARLTVTAAVAVPLVAATAFYGSVTAGAARGGASTTHASGTTRQISVSGTTKLNGPSSSGTATGTENPELATTSETDGSPISDRSNSGGGGGTSVGAITQPKPVTTSNPGLLASFQGLNHFQNRFGADNGHQFSLEPPDQGMCVGSDGNGNTRILETVNDVLRVYSTSGAPLNDPTALNPFLGYASAIVRNADFTKDVLGPFVTDPSCIYDAQTGHWFVDVLTLDSFPRLDANGFQHFTGTNHIDLAVSNSSDPLGAWTVYRIPVQDDGTDGTPNHHCAANTDDTPPVPTNPTACLGDYPHIGTDANGVYITTNEYSFFGIDFHGAQVYAFSKPQLASLSPTLTMTQVDTRGMDTFGFALNGFTLWPSQTPGGGGDPSAGGTEYFLSSNAAPEAHDTGNGDITSHPSTQLLTWALTNTSSLSGTPVLALSNAVLTVGRYALPPASDQKSGPTPLRDCLNNNPCSSALEGIADPFAEHEYALDSNDTRMQQVTWVNGHLWGALDTALRVSSATQAGIEWFNVVPSTSSGTVTAALANQGYVGLGNDNLTYPAIGLTAGGTGVMAFTLAGNDYFPSAGYATVGNDGVGAIHVAAMGQGPADGFSGYKLFGNPPGTTRPRWGDYGAAVAWGSNVWIASEYIGQSCTLSEYERTNFRCGSTRTALANWATRISEVAAP